MSSSPNENHMLAAWDAAAPLFLEEIEALKPMDGEGQDRHADLLIDLKTILNGFRTELANPDANPDFMELKKECNDLFLDDLTIDKVHDAQNILTAFFKYLLLVAIVTLAIGLAIMLTAEVGALLGILTLSAVSFKGLGIVSAISGGAFAAAITYRLFATHRSAATALDTLISAVTTDNEEQVAELAP